MGESRRMWTTPGPHIGTEPRLEFKQTAMYAPSLDRMYDTTRQTIGYRVHMSMWGSSLWDTTERFNNKTSSTSEKVGPGSYNTPLSPWDLPPKAHPPIYPHSPKKSTHKPIQHPPPTKECEAIISLDSWKQTSEHSASARPAFDKAARVTWIDTESTKRSRMRKRVLSTPNIATLPDFLSGVRTGAPKSHRKKLIVDNIHK